MLWRADGRALPSSGDESRRKATEHWNDVRHAARHGMATGGGDLHTLSHGDGALRLSGTEATMHAIRLARAATGRDKIIKFEGGYHGLHDSALVSVKPQAPDFGDSTLLPRLPAGGRAQGSLANIPVATFNDLATVELRFKQNPGEIAAIILEPIMMNVGLCMPQPGFLEGLRELATRNGALLIFDEVKTGAKLGWGGASEYFGVKPDMVCLAKSIGGGFPLAAFGASKRGDGPDLAAQGFPWRHVQHESGLDGGGAGHFPRSAHAGELCARGEAEQEADRRLSQERSRKSGLQAYVVGAGANGALMLYPKEIRNYRDWMTIDVDLWRHYWFGMVNRGVMPQPYWWDEQWTISVQHTEADIDKHLAAFADVAPALAAAQQERRRKRRMKR